MHCVTSIGKYSDPQFSVTGFFKCTAVNLRCAFDVDLSVLSAGEEEDGTLDAFDLRQRITKHRLRNSSVVRDVGLVYLLGQRSQPVRFRFLRSAKARQYCL